MSLPVKSALIFFVLSLIISVQFASAACTDKSNSATKEKARHKDNEKDIDEALKNYGGNRKMMLQVVADLKAVTEYFTQLDHRKILPSDIGEGVCACLECNTRCGKADFRFSVYKHNSARFESMPAVDKRKLFNHVKNNSDMFRVELLYKGSMYIYFICMHNSKPMLLSVYSKGHNELIEIRKYKQCTQ